MSKHSVLLIIDDYLPHSIKVGAKMMHELALELKKGGHEVTVLTPRAQQQNKVEIEILDGLKVIYFRSGEIKNVSLPKRLLNELTLSDKALAMIKWEKEIKSLDLIVYYSPSIFWGKLVRKLKKRYHAPAYLVLRDIFPQWVIDNRMIGANSLKAKFLRHFEKKSYQAADKIGLMSQKNLSFFRENIYKKNISLEVLYNWTGGKPYNQKKDLKKSLGLEDKVVFFYGGAIGYAQQIQNLIELAIDLKDIENCHFLFLGNGDEAFIVEEAAATYDNITYHGPVDQEQYLEFLAAADVCMFTLSSSHKSHNFPGKILSYMNANLPVIGRVNNGNDLIDLVNSESAAYVFDYINNEKLYDAARSLANDEKLRIKMGASGKKFLSKYFSVETAAKKILDLTKN